MWIVTTSTRPPRWRRQAIIGRFVGSNEGLTAERGEEAESDVTYPWNTETSSLLVEHANGRYGVVADQHLKSVKKARS